MANNNWNTHKSAPSLERVRDVQFADRSVFLSRMGLVLNPECIQVSRTDQEDSTPAWQLSFQVDIEGGTMAIDYRATFPCKVREAISDSELSRMEKARIRANTVLELMRNDPDVDQTKPESEWTFRTVVIGPDGPRETEIRIADAFLEAAPLKELSVHCQNCPANLRSDDFGCGGAIHYPITARAESWLLSRLPADLSTRAGQFLISAIKDFNYDGAFIDRLRGRKGAYESTVAPERKWGGFFSKKARITSSQILHMTFAVGDLGPAHAKMVAYFLGFLNDAFEVTTSSETERQPEDDEGIVELKYFYSLAALAGTSNVGVLVDA
jgi:hypothetical protein